MKNEEEVCNRSQKSIKKISRHFLEINKMSHKMLKIFDKDIGKYCQKRREKRTLKNYQKKASIHFTLTAIL